MHRRDRRAIDDPFGATAPSQPSMGVVKGIVSEVCVFWLAGLRGDVLRETSRGVTTFYPCRPWAEHHMLLAQFGSWEPAWKERPNSTHGAAKARPQVGNGRSNQPET